jgi:glycosyltransferase involved in cell wall biosynthesis
MTEPVVLAGPVNPHDLAEWLDPDARAQAIGTPGLRGTSLTNLAKAFLATGRSVELVTLAPEIDGEPVLLEGPGLRLLIGPYRRRARSRAIDAFRSERRSVRELLSKTSGSVVNAHWTYEFALGAAAVGGRSLVVTIHDAPLTILRRQPSAYVAVRTAMAVAVRFRRSVLTAVSAYNVAAWRRQMLDRRPIEIIANVVPIPEVAVDTGKNEAHPTILDIASAARLKNVATLVRAMPAILSTHSEAQLILAGPGLTPGSSLSRLAQELGVADSIEFLGAIDQTMLDPLFRRATVFAHASREESLAMTISEAMAYGLPVLGGIEAGGVPAQLDEGRAGMLVDTSRPADLAAGISRLLRDRQLRKQLGEAARKTAISQFSAATVTDAYLEVYERAAAGR